ncbi:hypothetical protein NIES46_12740 [Arthrospira platensis NIES-46]|uniref:Protein kinase domain-containing protein n=1 Tax=Limnospira platensis NIES-46 TaxID=1236695 RepID=A0A5M3T464_LIMPL|nr:DNA-binding protein [Arthrospira platensis]GCE93225.1 hypothetical protein NIES46_12740 [Arthrospira platensis NIES-46]
MRLQRQFNGKIITLDTRNPIGSGGEGRIYVVANDPTLVAKIYHNPTDEDADKLTLMYNAPPANLAVMPGMTLIAWPIDLLRTLDNRPHIVGYLMPRVTAAAPIHTFYTPKTRREQKPLFNYLYLHRTARNLAAAFNDIHSGGYVVGDVNESNILVSDTAIVTLVDTDSFQVCDPYTKLTFRCPVGKAEFTPPELQHQTFRDIDRTPEHDRFGLAVLIFQLLMEGTHPFSGVYQGSGDPPAIEARIKAGHFVYGKKPVPYQPMPLAPTFKTLHPSLQELFIRCFEDGYRYPEKRPTAIDWTQALKQAEFDLTTCAKNRQHRYNNHLKSCPWCDRTRQLGGRDPFPSREAVRSGEHLEPLKIKKRHRLTLNSRVTRPQQPSRVITPTTKSPRRVLKRPQPPAIIRSPRTWLAIWHITEGAIVGGVWGVTCLSAIVAIIFALFGPTSGILGAMIVGSIWGCFFGATAGLFIPEPITGPSKIPVIIGGLCGTFIAAAIAGVIFGALEQDALIGQAILWGAFMGMVWGTIWNLFKPPLSVPKGRVHGKNGMVLGAIWGAFLGTAIGSVLGAIAVVAMEIDQPGNSTPEIISRLFVTAIVAAGIGALGGILSGATFGSIGGAPPLPTAIRLAGRRGAWVGMVWGNFLGVITGAFLGAIASTLFPQLLQTNPSDNSTPLLLGAIIVSAGIGSAWGIFSGMIWGGLGKF